MEYQVNELDLFAPMQDKQQKTRANFFSARYGMHIARCRTMKTGDRGGQHSFALYQPSNFHDSDRLNSHDSDGLELKNQKI